MKYRRLTYEELEKQTHQFLQFLNQKSIDRSQWTTLYQTNPEYAQKLIDDFSDLVMEHKLNKIEYLEQRTGKTLKVLKFLKTKVITIHLQVQQDAEINLCAHASVANLLSKFETNMWNFIQLKIEEHKYTSGRAEEIFEAMKLGCFITKEVEFSKLYQLIKKGRRAA